MNISTHIKSKVQRIKTEIKSENQPFYGNSFCFNQAILELSIEGVKIEFNSEYNYYQLTRKS